MIGSTEKNRYGEFTNLLRLENSNVGFTADALDAISEVDTDFELWFTATMENALTQIQNGDDLALIAGKVREILTGKVRQLKNEGKQVYATTHHDSAAATLFILRALSQNPQFIANKIETQEIKRPASVARARAAAGI